MPDQRRYFNAVYAIRNWDWSGGGEHSPTVVGASRILAVVPLPFVLTIKSLGFFNKFIFSKSLQELLSVALQ